MSFFTRVTTYIGIEKTPLSNRMATLHKKSKGWEIAHLREFPIEDNVNLLDKLPQEAIVTTFLTSREVLVRNLEISVKKEKDIQAALPFQAEPLLPYPIEKCILQKTILEQLPTGTLLTFFSSKKESLQSHLDHWKKYSVDPDTVTCCPQALASFSSLLHLPHDPILLLHLGEKEGTSVLIEKGKVLAARAVEKEISDVQKTLFSLSSSSKTKKVEHILFLGTDKAFAEKIQQSTEKTLIYPQISSISDENLQKFGLAIGAAMAGGEEEGCNFRQKEFSYSKPLKRIKKPFLTFCTAAFLLFISSLGLTNLLLHKEEKNVQQEFASLLAIEKKENVDMRFSKENILNSLTQIEAEIQARPDTFPLLPTIPKVSDILAWLSTTQSGLEPSDISIDNLHYFIEKRPEFNHNKERYLVKLELEFTASNPAHARAFHETLMASNPFVDTKKEIQWTPGKNKYFISFYLKDKTRYY